MENGFGNSSHRFVLGGSNGKFTQALSPLPSARVRFRIPISGMMALIFMDDVCPEHWIFHFMLVFLFDLQLTIWKGGRSGDVHRRIRRRFGWRYFLVAMSVEWHISSGVLLARSIGGVE